MILKLVSPILNEANTIALAKLYFFFNHLIQLRTTIVTLYVLSIQVFTLVMVQSGECFVLELKSNKNPEKVEKGLAELFNFEKFLQTLPAFL
jgi:hypothetical protein